MGREQLQKTITDRWGEEHQWVFHHHPGREGLRLQAELLAIVTGGAGGIVSFAGVESSDALVAGTGAVFGALGGIIDRIVDKSPDQLLMRVIKYSARDGDLFEGKGSRFDKWFSGNYGELYQAVGHAIVHNFGSTFSLGNLLGGQSAQTWEAVKEELRQRFNEGLLNFLEPPKKEDSTGSSGSAQEANTPAD